MTNIRIGQGYDVHQLIEGRKLILGGVEIPFEKGCSGIPMPTRCCTPLPTRCSVRQVWATSAAIFPTPPQSSKMRTAASFACGVSKRSGAGLAGGQCRYDRDCTETQTRTAHSANACQHRRRFGYRYFVRQYQRQNQRKTRLSRADGRHRGAGGGIAGTDLNAAGRTCKNVKMAAVC